MKKLEVIMKPAAFVTFRASAARLGISEYDVSEVRLSTRVAVAEGRRCYRRPGIRFGAAFEDQGRIRALR